MAEGLRRPLEDPFAAEAVVIPTLGLERWLTRELARRQGICANISFLFPGNFVAGLMETALPERAAARFYARDNLAWRIMKSLPALAAQSAFDHLQRYLSQPRPELRRFQLAARIARSFDQYLAFRPGMILDWERGKGEEWQPVLWRELIRAAPGLHPPALAKEFFAALRRGAAPLPERVSVFGVSTLPPFYAHFFQELAQTLEVHLFLMRPTPHFWGDIRSEREELHARRRAPTSAQLDLQFERGNPLLASWGKVGREFLESVTELDPTREDDRFEAPPDDTALGQIQRDIFELHDPVGGPLGAIAAADRSIQIHSCHSPMREMEVLHDQLLALFAKEPALKPHDVVVMAPDISVYAPFIEAVFGTAPEQRRIPCSVADRGTRAENGVIDTFLRILELAGSRFTASSVVAILESVALQRRFDLAEPDLEVIRTWIEKAGIRWGIDAEHRGSLDLPEFGENSWRAGLDRLLLGYAGPAENERLFHGILAYDNVEGSLAETLGHFADFAEALFATARDLAAPRSLLDWEKTLREISLRYFPADDEREPELRHLRRIIVSLGETARLSEFDEVVPLEVLLAHLDQALTNAASTSGFLVGRVTFCALKPMRTVPFRVVCLVGMNDTAYPRHDRPPAFDLVAQHPQPGDRSTRDDDRYLFLEALLSARDVFYISYVGRSIRDNGAIPPSVLVSELRDYTGATVTEHPLQPFSPKYFTGDDGLFSYSTENCIASGTAAVERTTPPAFMSATISEPEAEWRRVDAAQLIRFFANPSKFLIRERLGMRIPRLDSLLEESEPLELDSLAKYGLDQDFLDRALRGETLDPLLPVIRAGGELPPGPAGESRLRELWSNARRVAEVVRQETGGRSKEPKLFEVRLGDFEVSARMANLHEGGLVRYRLTTRKAKDILAAWIDHLIVNCVQSTASTLVTATKQNLPEIGRLAPPAKDAKELLAELLDLYWKGLREPLPFFPRSAHTYAEHKLGLRKGKRTPIQQAHHIWGDCPLPWEPDHGMPPECEDEYFDLAFRNVAEPLGEEFKRVTMTVFEPALAVWKEEK